MKNKILIILINLFFLLSFAQSPNLEWQKTYGGTQTETANCIQQTSDGGYIVVGNTSSINGDVTLNQGQYDVWVVKLNSAGTIVWQNTFGGAQNDNATSVQQTLDGGYIIAGSTVTSNGYDNFWIIKLNSTGVIVWQNSIGGTDHETATSVQQTSDGGYIVGGYSYSNDGDISINYGFYDCWVVKLSASGMIVWQKTLGGSGDDILNSIIQTTDGGYIFAGQTNSNNGDVSGHIGYGDFWVVKLSALGTLVWQKTLGGTEQDNATSIKQTSDGGFIIAGNTYSNNNDVTGNNGDLDIWIVKINATGIISWQKTLGGTNTDTANSIQQNTDGGYIVGGSTYSNDGDVTGLDGVADFCIIKLSSTGVLVWQKTLGGTDFETVKSIQQTSDGGFIAAGLTGSNDGDITFFQGMGDWWVVKLGPETLFTSEFEYVENTIMYPNPSNRCFSIQNNTFFKESFNFKIINLKGQIVSSGDSKFNEEINIESLAIGNYIVQIQIENRGVINFKLVKN